MKTKTVSVKNKKNEFQLTFGADPEVLIFDTQQKRVVSAIDIFKRDKHDPIVLDKDGFVKTYFDNCMGEFTVRPASSREDFVKNIGESLHLINQFLIDNYGGRYQIKIQASHKFDDEFMKHPEALKIGCNPEYNADEIAEIVPPDFNGNLRSCGGHVAVGRTDFNELAGEDVPLLGFQSRIDLVKLMDYYLAIPFTLIDNDKTSAARRAIYGRPSSHRTPLFGVEYRVLSNYWIASPKLVGLVYDLAALSVEQLLKKQHVKIFKIDKAMVNAAIMENNKELAAEISDKLSLPKSIQIRLNQYRNINDWNVYKEWGLAKVNKTGRVFYATV